MLSIGRIGSVLARPATRVSAATQQLAVPNRIASSNLHTSSMICAVPKRKPSLAVRRTRWNSPDYAAKLILAYKNCGNCKTQVRTHHVCPKCGWKNGTPVTLAAIKAWKAKQMRGVKPAKVKLTLEQPPQQTESQQ